MMIPMISRTPAAAAPAYIAAPIPLPSTPPPVWVPSSPSDSKAWHKKEIKLTNIKATEQTWLLGGNSTNGAIRTYGNDKIIN